MLKKTLDESIPDEIQELFELADHIDKSMMLGNMKNDLA